jgi:hypothetical protein
MGQAIGSLKNSAPGFGGTNVADPGQTFGNMDSSQRGVSVIQGLGRGVGQGMQNMQGQQQAMQQGGGGAAMQAAPGAQPVDPSYFQPQQQSRRNQNMFFGGF